MSEKFYANFMFGVDAQLNPKTDIRFTYISKHSPNKSGRANDSKRDFTTWKRGIRIRSPKRCFHILYFGDFVSNNEGLGKMKHFVDHQFQIQIVTL